MIKKRCVVFVLIMFSIGNLLAQTNQDRFLGEWKLNDRTASIKIEKQNGKYYIIEFTNLKYELFFSPDNTRFMFYAWGKGEPHPVIMERGDGMLTQYTLSEVLEWIPGMIFYKEQ